MDGSKLTSGKIYYLKETKAPSGYEKSNNIYCCKIKLTGKVEYKLLNESDDKYSIEYPQCINSRKKSSGGHHHSSDPDKDKENENPDKEKGKDKETSKVATEEQTSEEKGKNPSIYSDYSEIYRGTKITNDVINSQPEKVEDTKQCKTNNGKHAPKTNDRFNLLFTFTSLASLAGIFKINKKIRINNNEK